MIKNYTLALLWLCLIGMQPTFGQGRSQRDKNNELRNSIFANQGSEFEVVQIPDKWTKESAVIIAQKLEYSYTRNNKRLVMNELVHKRIKLNDAASVKSFSKFYYREAKSVGFRIIKPDGSINDIDVDNALEISEEIPRVFRPYYNYEKKYFQIAIPGLEINDIIDFYYLSEDESIVGNTDYAFSPFRFTLNASYPIMSQSFEFNVDRGFYININSYNGAPEVQEGEAGVDSKGHTRASTKTYFLKDVNRDRLPDELWVYENRIYPLIKFQVYYMTPIQRKRTRQFVGEEDVRLSSVPKEKVCETLHWRMNDQSYFSSTYKKEFKAMLNRHHPKLKNKTKIAQLAYYFLRYKFLSSIYLNPETQEFEYSKSGLASIDMYTFAGVFNALLRNHGIETEIIVAVPRSTGKIEDILMFYEANLAVKIVGNPAVFTFPFNNFTTFEYLRPSVEGTDAYAFKPEKYQATNIKIIQLPVSSSQDNVIAKNLDVRFASDFSKVNFERENRISGNFKTSYSRILLRGHDYLELDRKMLFPKDREKPQQQGNRARLGEENRRKKALIDEAHNEIKKKMKQDLEDSFDVSSYDDFELIKDGRTSESSVLIFKDRYTLNNLINKAGPNYIFNAGQLIEKQLELESKNMTRDKDVYIDFAKSYIFESNIHIPAGYKVEGVEELNMLVDYPQCAFISQANVENNILTIKVKKIYKQHFVETEYWPRMIEFLDAAYHFTQKKVILKPI